MLRIALTAPTKKGGLLMSSADPERVAPRTFVDEAPPLPGLVIRREIMDRFEISQSELASAMGVSRPWLNQMLSGKNAISPELALRLGKVTATDPAYWMDVQSRFNLHRKCIELHETLDKLVELAARIDQ